MTPALAALSDQLSAQSPWWLPYRAIAERVIDSDEPSVVRALEAARQGSNVPRFIRHDELPAGEAYEAFIARTARVPTRENFHDFFNGLVWLAFPHTKRRLNELQARHIAEHGIGTTRGALRDALTLFDENSAVLQAPPVLIDALRRRDWRALFVTHREQWRTAQLVVLGHALLEKLMQPRKSITAHIWILEDISDVAVASSLDRTRLEAKDFLPLPVLGIPGWWSANEEPSFYDDSDVFRIAR